MWELLAPYAHARGTIVPRAAAAQEATFLLKPLVSSTATHPTSRAFSWGRFNGAD